MPDKEDERFMVRAENEEGQDEIEAHRKKAVSEDAPKDDESSDEVEGHIKKA